MRYRLKPSSGKFYRGGIRGKQSLLFRVRAQNEDGWGPWSGIGGPYPAIDFITVRDVTTDCRGSMARFSFHRHLKWEIQRRYHTGPGDEQYSTIAINRPHRRCPICVMVSDRALSSCSASVLGIGTDGKHGYRVWSHPQCGQVMTCRMLPTFQNASNLNPQQAQ